MFFYIVPYFYILFISLNIYFSRIKTIKFWYVVALLFPAILVFFLRGNVGTDTFFYIGLLDDYVHYGYSNMKYEPGFEFLGKTIVFLGFNPRFGVAFISLITTIILCKSYSRSKNELMLLAMLVFPLFFYDFTMNGIRYGLSFSIATLAVDYLYRKKNVAFTILGIVACSIQYSAVLVFLPFLLALVEKKYIIILSFLLAVIYFVFPENVAFITDRISGKRDAYSEIFAPSLTSGLAPMLIVLALYINFLWFNRGKQFSKVIHIILVLEILSFIMAKFTYAGLRFQGAFMYCMIVYLKNNSQNINIRKYTLNLVFLSVIGILLFVKNITTGVENELTPFLPYKFFWEERYLDKI